MPKQKMPWTMTTNQTTNSAEITIYGAIGESWWGESISAAQFSRDLKELGDEVENITVRINSVGGSVADGLAIRSTLRNHKAFVTVIVDGWAASIASIIAMAGDKIVMAKGSMMMIHNPMNGLNLGDAQDFRDMAEFLDKVTDSLVSVYASRTQLSPEELKQMLDAETWMSDEEAVDKGFADEIEDGTVVTAMMQGVIAMVNGVGIDASRFLHTPKLPTARVNEKPKPVINQAHGAEGGDEVVNLEELKNKYPDIFAAALAEGIQAERTRMQAIDELAMPGNADVIAKAKESGQSAAETAVAIIKANKEKAKKAINNMQDDANDAGLEDIEAGDAGDNNGKPDAKQEQKKAVDAYASAFAKARGVNG